MSDIGWLFVAFLAVWVGIGAYLLSIGVRQRRLEQKLDEIDSRTARS